jgi:gas vesicle protein
MVVDIIREIEMLFPLKFVAANIFMAGVTAGAVGGAAAVYVLSDQQRREKLKDCADKMRDNCKTMWNTKPTVPTAD